MSTERALQLLTRENPVREADLPGADALHVSVLAERILLEPRQREPRRTRRARRISALGAAGATFAAVAAILMVASPGGGRGVEDAAAAVRNAAAVTSESAERSGTAVVRITHGGELWAGRTIRWHGHDLSILGEDPLRQRAVVLVVDGVLYARDAEDGGWLMEGRHANIDPDSGTAPYEQLAAIRDDVGGTTLERITGGMTGLATRELEDGSIVYSGSVEARLIARETGFKEDEFIRVLPFGYVAHEEASNSDALIQADVTVGADGVVRGIAVSWGTWLYTVAYDQLGTTPPIKAPANAQSLPEMRRD
jgi:hypothetical protein